LLAIVLTSSPFSPLSFSLELLISPDPTAFPSSGWPDFFLPLYPPPFMGVDVVHLFLRFDLFV